MKYLTLLISLFLSFANANGQGITYVAQKNKPEPFFQKVSIVSDIGLANSFSISNGEGKSYTPEPKMNLGFEVECPMAYFQLSLNIKEKAPEFKLGGFIFDEKLVVYLAFSKQIMTYDEEPESNFSTGFEGNFDLLKMFKKEEEEEEDSKFSLSVSPFVEIRTRLPNEENWFNFGLVLKPKYHIFVRH